MSRPFRPRTIKVPGTKDLTMRRTVPHIDEAKRLIIEMLRQAVRDFINFADSDDPEERELHIRADQFLFEDDYWIDWGGQDRRVHEFLEIIDLDIDWFREGIIAALP